jgi:hypothetical protein
MCIFIYIGFSILFFSQKKKNREIFFKIENNLNYIKMEFINSFIYLFF